MVESSATITNVKGMHLRAASEIVKLASKFASEIRIIRGDIIVDAKSLLALLLIEGAQGVEVTVTADGSDEKEALEAMVGLIDAKFYEDE
jgi:phosphotransferase system HPr (HPr) family protein